MKPAIFWDWTTCSWRTIAMTRPGTTAYNQTLLDGYMYLNRPADWTTGRFIADNIMDYDYGFMTGFTPNQAERIQYALEHAYFIPGEAGKEAPQVRSAGQKLRFGKPIR